MTVTTRLERALLSVGVPAALCLVACGSSCAPATQNATPAAVTAPADDGWVSLFDGQSLANWRPSENPDSWSVKDGAIIAKGQPKSHLFYDDQGQPFTNFHLKLQVMARHNSNGGVYFHTQFQEGGWPKYGFEAQVNNTYEKDPIKTGSLYQVVDVKDILIEDDTWFDYEVRVEGDRVQISVNGKVLVDYVEPPGTQPGESFTRKLASGTFALQAHDEESEVHFRKLQVKRLP